MPISQPGIFILMGSGSPSMPSNPLLCSGQCLILLGSITRPQIVLLNSAEDRLQD